jgi:hypothetical protein
MFAMAICYNGNQKGKAYETSFSWLSGYIKVVVSLTFYMHLLFNVSEYIILTNLIYLIKTHKTFQLGVYMYMYNNLHEKVCV